MTNTGEMPDASRFWNPMILPFQRPAFSLIDWKTHYTRPAWSAPSRIARNETQLALPPTAFGDGAETMLGENSSA